MRSVLPWNFNRNKKVVGGREGEGSCLVFTVKMVIPMSGRQQRTKHSAGQGMETFFFFKEVCWEGWGYLHAVLTQLVDQPLLTDVVKRWISTLRP